MTKLGKDWFAKELPNVKSSTPPIDVPVMVGLTLFTTRMDQDLDNMFKASMDLLQKGGIIINDNQIVRIVAEKKKVSKRAEEHIEIFVHVLQSPSVG
jgi:Holliday junction resolvase RusA-like endonuclease